MSPRVVTALVLAILQVVTGKGVVEIKAVRYSSNCRDNWILKTECDTFFEFCLKFFTSPSDSLSQCDMGSYGPTNHYDDRNYIDFTYVTSFPGGIKNPLKFEVRRFETFDLKFVIRVRDDEAQGSEHLAWLTKVFTHRPAAMEQQSVWSSVQTASSGSYQFLFQFRSYCSPNFYTSACDVYCLAQDSSSGHYTCNQATGAKVCMPGWTGETCTTDIDECAQGICHNGANCTNLPAPTLATARRISSVRSVNFCKSSSCLNGATCVPIVGNYSCVCPKGWMGSNCQTEVNACLSSPCINNGTCVQVAGGEFTCKCTADYGGAHCEKYLDPCLSSPCHNSGTCVRLTHDEFKCTCPVDFTGAACSQYVDVCESSPCQQAGTCTRLAHDRFRCSCTVDYGGPTCEEYRDPCLSRPCLNGATCTRLTHDKYQCSCPVDYTGRECQDYVDPCSSDPCYNLGSCVREAHDVFRCNCTQDYRGGVCEEFVDPCRSLPCLHSGTCVRQAYDDYTCNCTHDYTGSECEKYVDPCRPDPCENSATCVREDFTNYTCVCSAGYTGMNCSQPVGQVGSHAASLQDSKNDNPFPSS
ncbi:fibropellin-1-like [Pomacea canaliculata]|uniref:fibropellin-1-like n=1 Tax=Pomacea canaliculata TaxID=400727 RepID=UPI000D72F8D0|nr:fibropellin-1-like [Pomacea canaliculata]